MLSLVVSGDRSFMGVKKDLNAHRHTHAQGLEWGLANLLANKI